jgi:broad specificity phosphatase PhoE
MKTVWVRHGESEYNEQGLATGWHDPELTELGKQQAKDIAERIATEYPEVAGIYSSDLRRCFYTAELIKEHTSWDNDVTIDNMIRERDWGEWTGLTLASLNDMEIYASVRQGWNKAAPDGESLRDVAGRVATFMKDLEENDLPYIIVSHGHTIRAASVVLQMNTPAGITDWEVKNGEHVEWVY